MLDPSLPDSARQLRDEDFFDGLPRPLSRTDCIRIAVDLTDFEENEDHVAILGDHLVGSDPMVARLTYLFQPREAAKGKKLRESDYEFIIYGGDRPQTRVGYDVRSAIPLDVLPALRDAEGDLASWRRSPLRPLLDEASSQIDRDKLKKIAEGVSTATDAVAKTTEIKELANQISDQLKQGGPGPCRRLVERPSHTGPRAAPEGYQRDWQRTLRPALGGAGPEEDMAAVRE